MAMIALAEADFEDAQWHELERSCRKTAAAWLMIGCLPANTYRKNSSTSFELKEILHKYGHVERSLVVDAKEGFCRHLLLKYSTREQTEKAIKGMQNREFHGRTINISWLKSKWPLKTTASELGAVYGSGIQLYFQFMRQFIWLTLFTALLASPLLYFNLTGNALDQVESATESEGLISHLAASTICNLGTWRQYTNSSGAVIYSRRVLDFGDKIYDIRNVTLCGALLDAFACLLIWCMCLWYEFFAVPQCEERARKKAITPEVFSVHVTCLPKFLKTGKGNAYEERISRHFTRLLQGKIMNPAAARNMLVVWAEDTGSRERGWRWLCCPCGARGRDLRGRRLGQILEVNAPNRRCCVRWMKTRRQPQLDEWCGIDELCDAELIERLETNGCDQNSYRGGERLVHEVSLVRDWGGNLGRIKRDAKDAEVKAEKSRRSMMVKTKRKIEEKDIQEIPTKQRAVIGAFIIFSRMQHRNFLLTEYRFSRTWLRPLLLSRRLQFSGFKIRVEETTPPSDIFWENLDAPFSVRARYRGISFLVILVTMFAVIGLCSLAKQYANEAAEEMRSDCEVDPLLDLDTILSREDMTVECKCSSVGYYKVMRDNPEGIYELCYDWLQTKARAAGISTGASIAIVVVNCVASTLAIYLAKIELPKSLTDFNISIFGKSFIMQVLNLCVISVLVHAKFEVHALSDLTFGLFGKGSYNDLVPEWYVVVGGAILMIMLVTTIYPIVGILQAPMFHLGKRDCCCRKKRKLLLKSELLDLYTPPEFAFAVLHSQILCSMFTCLVFSSGMPILWVMLPANLIIEYWSDKLALLRGSQMPPRYRGKLMTRLVHWLQFGLVVHAGFAMWVFSQPSSAPSYCSSCGDQDAYDLSEEELQSALDGTSELRSKLLSVGPLGKHEEIGKVIQRTYYTSTTPAFMLLVLFGGYYTVRLLYYIFGHSMRKVLQYCRSSEVEDKKSDIVEGGCKLCNMRVQPDPVFYEPFAKTPLREMLRLKVVCTYQLTQMPGYEVLGGRRVKRQGSGKWQGAGSNIPGKAKPPAPVSARTTKTFSNATSGTAASTVKAKQSNYFPAAEDAREQEYFSLIEAQQPAPEPQAQWTNEADEAAMVDTEVEGLQIEQESSDEVYEGMILVCQKEGNVYELSDTGRDMEITGKVQPGEILVAAGPIENEAGFTMVPILPCGYVELATVQNKDGEVGDANNADAEWWEKEAPAVEVENEVEQKDNVEETGPAWSPEEANMKIETWAHETDGADAEGDTLPEMDENNENNTLPEMDEGTMTQGASSRRSRNDQQRLSGSDDEEVQPDTSTSTPKAPTASKSMSKGNSKAKSKSIAKSKAKAKSKKNERSGSEKSTGSSVSKTSKAPGVSTYGVAQEADEPESAV